MLRNTHLLKLSVWVAPKTKRIIIRIIFIFHWLILLVRQHLRDPGALNNKCMFVTNVTPFKGGIKRLCKHMRFIAKKHWNQKRKRIHQTQISLLSALRLHTSTVKMLGLLQQVQWLYRQTATKHTCNPASTITSTHKCIQECVLVL